MFFMTKLWLLRKYCSTVVPFARVFFDNKASPQYYTDWGTIRSGQVYSNGELYIRKIVSMGLNAIRLGVHWESIEPSGQGSYTSTAAQTYIGKIKDILQTCYYYNIKVLIDFHQDGWYMNNSPPSGYQGWASYAKANSGTCRESSQPSSYADNCDNALEGAHYNKKWINDWHRLWHNTGSTRDNFMTMVKYFVGQLSGKSSTILAISDFNEPVWDLDTWNCYDDLNQALVGTDNQYRKDRQGTVDQDHFDNHPTHAGKRPLDGACKAFYDTEYATYATKFNEAIEQATLGTNYLRVFNSLVTERLKYVPSSRFANMGSKSILGKSFYYGDYVPPGGYPDKKDELEEKAQLLNAAASAAGRPALVTEWGAVVNDDLTLNNYALDAFDDEKMHAFYYAFRHTAGSGYNSNYDVLNDEPSTYNSAIVNKIMRPYPRAICGKLSSFSYDDNTKAVSASWSTYSPDGTNTARTCGTDIFMPLQDYPNGYTVNCGSTCTVQSSAGAERLVIWRKYTSTTSVSLTIAKI